MLCCALYKDNTFCLRWLNCSKMDIIPSVLVRFLLGKLCSARKHNLWWMCDVSHPDFSVRMSHSDAFWAINSRDKPTEVLKHIQTCLMLLNESHTQLFCEWVQAEVIDCPKLHNQRKLWHTEIMWAMENYFVIIRTQELDLWRPCVPGRK